MDQSVESCDLTDDFLFGEIVAHEIGELVFVVAEVDVADIVGNGWNCIEWFSSWQAQPELCFAWASLPNNSDLFLVTFVFAFGYDEKDSNEDEQSNYIYEVVWSWLLRKWGLWYWIGDGCVLYGGLSGCGISCVHLFYIIFHVNIVVKHIIYERILLMKVDYTQGEIKTKALVFL